MIDVEKVLEKMNVTYYFGAQTTHLEGFEVPLEISTCSKFYYVTEGEYELVVDGKAYLAKPGSLFFIPAGIPLSRHYINETRSTTQYFFHFDFVCPAKPDLFEELALPYELEIGIRKEVIRYFNAVIRHAKSHSLQARLRLTAAILGLLAYYIDKSGCVPLTAKGDLHETENKTITKITKYIKNNIDRQISNRELAEIACMQENYFIRYFKKQTGMTPHKFIIKVKLDVAIGLLENTDTSIGKVMEKIGFYDMSHFSKTFKQFHGMPPADYVKKFRNTKFKSDGIEKS